MGMLGAQRGEGERKGCCESGPEQGNNLRAGPVHRRAPVVVRKPDELRRGHTAQPPRGLPSVTYSGAAAAEAMRTSCRSASGVAASSSPTTPTRADCSTTRKGVSL